VVEGADLMGGVGCLNCHTYASQGAAGPGPELTNVGEGGEDVAYWKDWIRDPSALGGEGMPGFPTLTDEQLEALGTFLEASKGGG
jgi:mono/diheme cytochrome c family protein